MCDTTFYCYTNKPIKQRPDLLIAGRVSMVKVFTLVS